MSENALNKINNIPVRTWRWLGVNNVSIDTILPKIKPYKLDIFIDNNEKDIKLFNIDNSSLKAFNNLDYKGLSEELTEQVKSNYNTGFLLETTAYKKHEEPVIINYFFDSENSTAIDNNIIVAEEGSEVTLVVRYTSKEDLDFFHNGLTRIYCKKGSTVNIVRIQTLSDKSIHLDASIAELEDDAKINYVLVELGSDQSITNFQTNLNGFRSSAEMHTVYIGDKERNIDINYLINHIGKETKSSIEAKGALLDKSSKIFKGTLDFKRGSSKAKGEEEEYAVLLSPKVRNRSVPILLCTEEDVEGQHAASAGKIDENKLFYLMTRGLSENEAKKLIIEAAVSPIIDRIPVEGAKAEIYDNIRRKLSDE